MARRYDEFVLLISELGEPEHETAELRGLWYELDYDRDGSVAAGGFFPAHGFDR